MSERGKPYYSRITELFPWLALQVFASAFPFPVFLSPAIGRPAAGGGGLPPLPPPPFPRTRSKEKHACSPDSGELLPGREGGGETGRRDITSHPPPPFGKSLEERRRRRVEGRERERERDAMGEVRGPFPHSSSVGSDEGDRYDPFFLPPFLRLRLVFLSFFLFPPHPKKGG